jgi:hypothetical protein
MQMELQWVQVSVKSQIVQLVPQIVGSFEAQAPLVMPPTTPLRSSSRFRSVSRLRRSFRIPFFIANLLLSVSHPAIIAGDSIDSRLETAKV